MYLDEHIRDIVVKDAKEVKPTLKEYICIKDYIMDDGRLAYKQGVIYTTDGIVDDDNFFIMPSLFDDTHQMDTSGDFYEHFLDVDKERNKTSERFKNYREESEWDITSKNHIPIFDDLFYAGKENKYSLPTQDSIVNNVIESFIERSNLGFAKYGTNLDRNDLSFLDWLNHAQQEAMDMILYLEKLKQEYNE
jgi:hypothetical protein